MLIRGLLQRGAQGARQTDERSLVDHEFLNYKMSLHLEVSKQMIYKIIDLHQLNF